MRQPNHDRRSRPRQVTVLLLCLGMTAYFAHHAVSGRGAEFDDLGHSVIIVGGIAIQIGLNNQLGLSVAWFYGRSYSYANRLLDIIE